MAERKVSNDFGVVFRPELWTNVERFQMFIGEPFPDIGNLRIGTKAVSDHLEKFKVLAGLANRLARDLELDHSELEARGYSSAVHSKEYAAIVESLITTLYSVLDGLRQALYGAYRKVQRIQNSSNERMFNLATDQKYGAGFPESIRTVLADANSTWFPEFRRIRTELTHRELGTCHWDPKTGTIVYMHGGLGSASKAHVIDDFPKALSDWYAKVYELVQCVFRLLGDQLTSVERSVVCGFYRGRVYERKVALTADMTFHSGACLSRSWFDKSGEVDRCPVRGSCGAYSRVGPPPGEVPSRLVSAEDLSDLTRTLAYRLWKERGQPMWDDQWDWFEAESRLRGSGARTDNHDRQ
jgi:hypothetical protein